MHFPGLNEVKAVEDMDLPVEGLSKFVPAGIHVISMIYFFLLDVKL